MSGRIFVCLTCNRYAPEPAGAVTPGQRLAVAVKAAALSAGSGVTVRTVVCLNSCPNPRTAALREPGKGVIRFSRLTNADAPALVEAAALYAQSSDGDIPAESLPGVLRNKVASHLSVAAA